VRDCIHSRGVKRGTEMPGRARRCVCRWVIGGLVEGRRRRCD